MHRGLCEESEVSCHRRHMPEPPTHTAVCQTTLAGQGTTLKITLTPKFLAKPLLAALIKPFIGAVNKKLGTATKLEDVERVSVDGTEVDLTTGVAGDVLSRELHHVEILLKPTAVDVSDSSESGPAASAKSAGSSPGSSSSDPVERVCAAANEFELLELPLEAASNAAVRKSYRRISLLVHPDKVSHPRASEAFRKAFDAMQCLMDQKRQAARLRQLTSGGGGGGDDGSSLPAETRWWEGATVSEMEQAFRNLEEFFEARGAFGEDQVDDHLWVEPAEAERLRRRGLAFFVDARDTPDYNVSHVKDAHSLPGHTTGQLEGLLQHPVVLTLARSPASIVIVYSDNGSKLSRCVNVSRILRHVLAPERVRRLRGGLNGWKREALPVDGDARLFFAGKPMSPAQLGNSMAGMGLQ